MLQQPVLYVAGKQDYICLAQIGIAAVTRTCKTLTIKEFDSGHWIPLEVPNELNAELLMWIEGLGTKA
jgi:soluble epoxide hydrolase / lipid-phosphate phosphatase